MNKPIDQKSVDQVAQFVEVCSELENEPFFGKDEKLTFLGAEDRWTFTFGDRFHFRSALISFRRLWLQKEPSNWEKVLSILKSSELPVSISAIAKHHEKQVRDIICRDLHLLKLKMPSDRILDLWLNTVFAHGGLEGRNKRRDFEAAVDKYGHALFEYTFRSIVHEIGREFLNISKFAAKPMLDFSSQNLNLNPSFRIGAAFGIKRKERTKEGHLIVREGTSEFFSEETLEGRFNRILARHENRYIKFVLEHLDANVNELLRATLKGNTLFDLLNSLDGQLKTKSLNLDEFKPTQGMRASWGIDGSRIDVYEDCVVITDEKGAKALDIALKIFREQFLKD